MRSKSLSFAILAVIAAACSSPRSEAILVRVTSSGLSVPADLDRLEFEIHGNDGKRLAGQAFDLTGSFPYSVQIAAAPDRAERNVRLTVSGTRQGTFVIRRVVSASLDDEEIIIELTADCAGIACPGDQYDCRAGQCIPTDAPILNPATPADAGVSEDSGAVVTMPDAGTTEDEDAGAPIEDAGISTEEDSGSAHVDAGSTEDGGVATDDPPCLVISEFSTRGPSEGSSAYDEFLEIYNCGDSSVDLTGYRLEYRSGTGTTWQTRTTIEVGDEAASTATIAPGGFYLLGGPSYSRDAAPDYPNAWSNGFSDGGGHLRLMTPTNVELDRVGWGTAVEPEGSAVERLDDEASASYERKASASSTPEGLASDGAEELTGNAHDTDDNAADFVHQPAPNPQNTASPPEN